MPELPLPTQESDTPSTDGAESELGFWKIFRQLGPAAWLGVLWSSAPAIMGFWLLASIGPVSEWLESHGSMGLVVYVAIFALSAGAGLLPTYAQAIVGGWVFGFWAGLIAALIGFTAASILGRVISRFVARDRVERLVERHPKSAAVRRALVGRGFWPTLAIVTLVRVPPNSPFAMTNLLLTSVGVRWWPYVLGTALGMAPRTAVAAYVAYNTASNGAQSIQEAFKRDPWFIIVSIVLMLMVIAIISAIGNHALNRMTDESDTAQPKR